MNPIYFIFLLISKFIHIPPADAASMRNSAEEWYSRIPVWVPPLFDEFEEMLVDADGNPIMDEDGGIKVEVRRERRKDNAGNIIPEQNTDMLSKAKYYAGQWYVMMGLCFLFIFAVRWVADYMNGSPKENEPQDIFGDK